MPTTLFSHNGRFDKFWSVLILITNNLTENFEIFSESFPIFWCDHSKKIVSARNNFYFNTLTVSVDPWCLSNCCCWIQPLKVLNLRLKIFVYILLTRLWFVYKKLESKDFCCLWYTLYLHDNCWMKRNIFRIKTSTQFVILIIKI